jgi:hypothetical protein
MNRRTSQIQQSQISGLPELQAQVVGIDVSGKVDKITGYSLVADTEIAKIHASGSDNQDLSGLQPKETGKGLSANDLTAGLKSNYDAAYSHSQAAHAPSGAEQNVQADWTEADGGVDAFIKNKPTLGTAAAKNIPAAGNASVTEVVYGSDTRLGDDRTPSAHGNDKHSSTFITIADVTGTKIDDLTAGDDNTDLNATTDKHGLVVKPVAPAANVLSVVAIANGEAAYTCKALFDGTNPAALGVAAPGTSLLAAHRDHVHAAPTTVSGNAGTATILETARNIGGRSFNGSADIVASTWKCGQLTRDISTASGAQNIAHGLGRVPSFVHLRLILIFSSSQSQECNAYYDGTNQSGMTVCWVEGTSTASTDFIYQSTAAAIGLSNAGATNPFSGATKASAVITVDATNIILTWTKSGSPTGTAYITWEVQ